MPSTLAGTNDGPLFSQRPLSSNTCPITYRGVKSTKAPPSFLVFKENVYASLIDCAQRISARAEGAGCSNVGSWITSELGWNVRRPQSKLRVLGHETRLCLVLADSRTARRGLSMNNSEPNTLVSHSRLDSPVHVKTWGDHGEELLISRSLIARSSVRQPFASDLLQHITVRLLERVVLANKLN
ncbi:hypothetical protein B0H13DRAFT_1900775 [Mycena leptocephala]|nr:hypothetical protein B0H13DRAFT_1900775 [Mycena leptocephala]